MFHSLRKEPALKWYGTRTNITMHPANNSVKIVLKYVASFSHALTKHKHIKLFII